MFPADINGLILIMKETFCMHKALFLSASYLCIFMKIKSALCNKSCSLVFFSPKCKILHLSTHMLVLKGIPSVRGSRPSSTQARSIIKLSRASILNSQNAHSHRQLLKYPTLHTWACIYSGILLKLGIQLRGPYS